MADFHEHLLATSIRMHSLYQTALSLCSVKRFADLVEQLLPHTITAMDVATACLLGRDGTLYTEGRELDHLDRHYLTERSWRDVHPYVQGELPSGVPFLAAAIRREDRTLGTLIVANKEVADFEAADFRRIRDLSTVTSTALENIYTYENLLERSENLEEEIRRRDEIELQRLRAEVEAARLTQLSLLPRQPPLIAGLDIQGICLPAREVGGDFYDYITLGFTAESLAIVVADVSGKGVKSALYAVLSYGILHAEAKFGASPAHMLWVLNDELRARISERMNCAMCIATIDTENRKLRYANAGMPYAIFKRDDEVCELVSDGMPLGAFKSAEYLDLSKELHPRDVLVFLSDGITEAMSEGDVEQLYIETHRLFDVIAGFTSDMSAEAMIHAILADVRSFSGTIEQSDDITIVVVKVCEEK